VQGLPDRLLAQRDAVAEAVGGNWWQALVSAAGKWMFDYLTLVFSLAAVGAQPAGLLTGDGGRPHPQGFLRLGRARA
jgi:hypothetical protein